MDHIVIERENNTKFLDVLTDDNISWKQHINDVSTKIQKSIGILYKSREIKITFIKTVAFFIYSLPFELCKNFLGKHLQK